jgi:hypothetical protein
MVKKCPPLHTRGAVELVEKPTKLGGLSYVVGHNAVLGLNARDDVGAQEHGITRIGSMRVRQPT